MRETSQSQPRLRGFRRSSQRSLASGGAGDAVATLEENANLANASAVAWAREHWPLLIVLLAFAASALIVPTFAPVATTDDWAYARSAQILLEEGRLTVFPVVAATAVFQIAWGALFGLLFGPTFGAFRLSTVVITAFGALALYGLCRDLGVSPQRSALGIATYLFNPLVFVLAFTFMTDAHFVALLVIATWLFAKALVGSDNTSPTEALTPSPSPVEPGEGSLTSIHLATGDSSRRQRSPSPSALGEGGRGVRASLGEAPVDEASLNPRLIIAASAVSALAFLTRQQGALIVPAVILFLLLTRRLRVDRASFLLLLQILALPVVAMGGYFLWLRYGNDVPGVQVSFFREVLEEGWSGTWWLVQRLAVVDLLYLGLFTLPLMAAALPSVKALARGISRRGGILLVVWAVIAVAGVMALWTRGARMPYVAQFFGAGGLGAPDVLGSRPILLTPEMRGGLTVICLIASLLLALVAARAVLPAPAVGARPASPGGPQATTRPASASPVRPPSTDRAGLVLCIGLGQVIGVFPPSYHYIGWAAGSLDRYLLPLAPLAVALALWGLRDVRLALPLGWALAIGLGLFAVAGTRDYLVFMREVWAMGDRAVAAGVSLNRLDAGSGWDGYHLYEYGREYRIRSRTPKGGPWWVYFYAPATDSAYVVAGKLLPGHFVVARRSYSSWLLKKPANLYLLRRRGAPWPPNAWPRAILTRPAPGGLQIVPEPANLQRPTPLPMPTLTPEDELGTGTEADDA